MWSVIKSVFGFQGVGDTALKIVERITGTDDSPQQKRQFLLDWAAATKHQSPMRRIIAVAITFMWLMLGAAWFVSSAIGRFYYDSALNPGTVFAADISAFMSLNINEYFALIVAFYFVMQITTGLKK